MNRLTEKRKWGYPKHIFKDFDTNYADITILDKVARKLGQLEDIEELYGCPLIAIFEALENGAWVKDEMWGICHWIMPFIARDYDSRNTPKATLYLAFEKSGQKRYFALKDFGKTWAFTREELENVN